MSLKILVVEDDPKMVEVLETGLAREGFEVVSVRDGVEALAFVETNRPDFIILDLVLPRLGGMEVCQKVRADSRSADLPIIVLSGQTDRFERVRALNAGADDYVNKPFHMDELVARIRAVQRRAVTSTESQQLLKAGLIEMDPERWTVTVGGAPVTLTPKEFGLLRILLEARGRVLTREYLLEAVWSHGVSHGLDTRTVDVHVWRLRRKLGEAGKYIITVRNVGYRFEIFLEWTTLGSGNQGEDDS